MIAAAAKARRGGCTYTLWPDARQPMISADMGYPAAAEWLRRTMVPTLRRLPDAATWMSLRARAALVGEEAGLAAEVGQAVVGSGTPLRVAMYSPSGQAVSKAICFLFREGEGDPTLVVKAMAEPRFSWRLRRESALLEEIRARVAHDPRVAAGLPAAPLFAGDVAAEFMLVEPVDPLGTATGGTSRERALEWLRGFHIASCSHEQAWAPEDERVALAVAREAWRLAAPGSEDAVVDRVRALLGPLRGAVMPRCAVHGDFWRGNVAARDDAIRVYDWEWAAHDGTPLFDLWTYELAELRVRARDGADGLEAGLEDAVERIRAELRDRGIDERFALAMLAPVLGGLAFRIRDRLGMPDAMEQPSISVMRVAARLLPTS